MKKAFAIAGLVSVSLLTAACSESGSGAENETVGISMPDKSLERWEKDGNNMVTELEGLGYNVDIQYAQGETQTQSEQIENMITKKVDALIIAPVDGSTLSDPVNLAANQDIPVIAYDRLIMNTENLDYYTTFDLVTVGEIQGQYIVDALDLDNTDESFNIELFGGAPDDNNARFFFEGAMNVMQPYMDEGQLIVQSGQVNFNSVATESWSASNAQTRMDNLLTGHYTDKDVDAILAQNDAIAQGVVSSLVSMGYGSESRPMPIITGQDAEVSSVNSIIEGNQTMTVFKDTSALAKAAAAIVDAILNGDEPEVNDTESFDNNEKVIPTYLLDPIAVDAENYQEILIDSGYIDSSDVE
ncbi:multiple monosaccharide ABC transporter substrate-binding protein [Alkalibacterium sp. f15]|uniref:multiple monosaccharide ABC transporter substrate-binding protein n=1 Tax=Alkalibacterium sp. f15 TaxID=3414029 RepID=UPI003BF7FE2A